MNVRTVPIRPFAGQRPGTSGLRKKVPVFKQPGYVESFVQSLFDVLPDRAGKTLVVGGGRSTNGQNTSEAVYEAEMWNPATETWTTMAAMQRPRLYHSTALLLPDGRVISAGGNFPPI